MAALGAYRCRSTGWIQVRMRARARARVEVGVTVRGRVRPHEGSRARAGPSMPNVRILPFALTCLPSSHFVSVSFTLPRAYLGVRGLRCAAHGVRWRGRSSGFPRLCRHARPVRPGWCNRMPVQLLSGRLRLDSGCGTGPTDGDTMCMHIVWGNCTLLCEFGRRWSMRSSSRS